ADGLGLERTRRAQAGGGRVEGVEVDTVRVPLAHGQGATIRAPGADSGAPRERLRAEQGTAAQVAHPEQGGAVLAEGHAGLRGMEKGRPGLLMAPGAKRPVRAPVSVAYTLKAPSPWATITRRPSGEKSEAMTFSSLKRRAGSAPARSHTW